MTRILIWLSRLSSHPVTVSMFCYIFGVLDGLNEPLGWIRALGMAMLVLGAVWRNKAIELHYRQEAEHYKGLYEAEVIEHRRTALSFAEKPEKESK